MKTLEQYLDGAGCEKALKQLVGLIAAQAGPVRQAFLRNRGLSASRNIHGDVQAELDRWADTHFTEVLKKSGLVRRLASEEGGSVMEFPGAGTDYAVVMDPLDGSSLVDVNLAVGSIFGIFRGAAMQKAENMAAALYLLYGPLTTLTLSIGKGAHIFGLREGGGYVMLEENVRMP